MNCDQIRDLLEAYSIGALDPDERIQVATHLSTCRDCAALARDYEEMVQMLPAALAEHSPHRLPETVKGRVMATIATNHATPTPVSRPAERPRRRLWTNLRVVAALLLVILLIFSLIWGTRVSSALTQERALREELASLVDQQEVVLDIIDSSTTSKVILRPPVGSKSDAYGKVFIRPDQPYIVVMAARLPSPPAGQSYHLSITRNNQPQLANIMPVNSVGFGVVVLKTEQNGPTYDAVQLTLQSDRDNSSSGSIALVWQKTP